MTTEDETDLLLAAAQHDADVAAERSRVTVRTLHAHEELAEARRLWDAVWPSPTGTEVTSNHLRAIEHSGGYVGGAYDGDEMVGACLAFVGRSMGSHGDQAAPAGVVAVARDRPHRVDVRPAGTP